MGGLGPRTAAETPRVAAMYQRFTDKARKVVQLANQEAVRLCHEQVGTEHLLLGILKEGSGIAATVLGRLGVEFRMVRLEVEKAVPSGTEAVRGGWLPKTAGAKRVIEYAIEEAANRSSGFVGTEHLLLGLLRGEGVVGEILLNLGLSIDRVRAELLAVLRGDMGITPPLGV